jgi:purine-binding chemotaxis protein CheW
MFYPGDICPMSSNLPQEANNFIQEFLIVTVADSEYCIDINLTLGINRIVPITKVPKSPEYVCGVINLRGQVVTVVDLGLRLGKTATKVAPQNRIIIISDTHESIGLLVDKVIDTIQVNSANLEPPPANLGDVVRFFLRGVYRDEARVVGILDMAKIISLDSPS